MEWISIGKFANMVGLTPTTLRRMHDTGELIPCPISKGGTRYDSTKQLDQFLNRNQTEKRIGMPKAIRLRSWKTLVLELIT